MIKREGQDTALPWATDVQATLKALGVDEHDGLADSEVVIGFGAFAVGAFVREAYLKKIL